MFHLFRDRSLGAKTGKNDEGELSSFSEETQRLAEEFGVSDAGMDAFLNRFSPSRTVPGQFKADSDVVLFLHIPKTAGISVGKTLQRAFDEFRGIDWKDVSATFRHQMRMALYMQTQEKKRQVIMGHFGWAELQIWKSHDLPMKCATVLRDPVARMVSNYNYNCSDAHPEHVIFKERYPTLTAFVQSVPIDMQISTAIGFIDSFETALQRFVTQYSFLGVTEQLGRSLAHLGRSHGLPKLTEYRENVGKIKPEPDLPADVLRRIESRSYNDRKMHRLLMRIYGAD